MIKTLQDFSDSAETIQLRHLKQTTTDVLRLTIDYDLLAPKKRIFNYPIKIWDAIMHLGLIHDPTDKQLFAVSQLTHTLQVVSSMLMNNINDEDLLITAWLHDIGKLLLLTDEDPSNIVCLNYVIEGELGSGLDNCVCSWNHDEYAYLKFGHKVSEKCAWLIRYHSLNLKKVQPYLNLEDEQRIENWLKPFMYHDKRSKSIYNFPQFDYDKHRKMLEKFFPEDLEL